MEIPEEEANADDQSIKRREALARIGRFAVYTTPAVIGMLTASKAMATSGGGAGGCCWVEAQLADGRKVGEASEGDRLLMMEQDGSRLYEGIVERTRPSLQPCLFFQTVSGIGLTLSMSTPIPVRRHGKVDYLVARDVLQGDVLPVRDSNGFRFESLDVIEERGTLPVSLLSAGGGVYAAGDEQGRQIFTHNMSKVIIDSAQPRTASEYAQSHRKK